MKNKTELQTPEADFYEILQLRIDEIKFKKRNVPPFDNSDLIIEELKYLQTQFNSYLYKIRNKKQCD